MPKGLLSRIYGNDGAAMPTGASAEDWFLGDIPFLEMARADVEFKVSDLKNPAMWLENALGAGSISKHAPVVNSTTAMRLSVIFRCISFISTMCGMLPRFVYRTLDNGAKEKAKDHYLYPIVHDNPNPFMKSMAFAETIIGHMKSGGNGYAEIEFSNRGQVKALWPIPPERVTKVYWGDDKSIKYDVRLDDGSIQTLDRSQVFHVADFSHNGLTGLSVIANARRYISAGLAMAQYAEDTYVRGANTSGIINYPRRMKGEVKDAYEKKVNDTYTGLSNDQRLMFLPDDVVYKQTSMSPSDVNFVAQVQASDTAIAAQWFGLPPSVVGNWTAASFKNAREMATHIHTYALQPTYTRLELEYDRLFSEADSDIYSVQHEPTAFLRSAPLEQGRADQFLISSGQKTINEARAENNRPPLPGGDEPLMSANVVTLDSLINPDPEPEPPEPPEPNSEEDTDEDQT